MREKLASEGRIGWSSRPPSCCRPRRAVSKSRAPKASLARKVFTLHESNGSSPTLLPWPRVALQQDLPHPH